MVESAASEIGPVDTIGIFLSALAQAIETTTSVAGPEDLCFILRALACDLASRDLPSKDLVSADSACLIAQKYDEENKDDDYEGKDKGVLN